MLVNDESASKPVDIYIFEYSSRKTALNIDHELGIIGSAYIVLNKPTLLMKARTLP